MTPAELLKREVAKAKRESLELALAQQLRAERIHFETQYEFWPGRKFRFDFIVWRPYLLASFKVAVEVQGGIWKIGGHSSGAGIEGGCEKAAHAAIAGWRLLPVTGGQIKSGKAIGWIKQALEMA
jgi:hypothetical protein